MSIEKTKIPNAVQLGFIDTNGANEAIASLQKFVAYCVQNGQSAGYVNRRGPHDGADASRDHVRELPLYVEARTILAARGRAHGVRHQHSGERRIAGEHKARQRQRHAVRDETIERRRFDAAFGEETAVANKSAAPL